MKTQLWVSLILIFSMTPHFAHASWFSSETDEKPAEIQYKEAKNADEMRKLRRMAIGIQAVGALGLVGAVLEMDFTPAWAFSLGYGGGGGFQAWEGQAKYIMLPDSFSPYFDFGFARWTSNGNLGEIHDTTPSILGNNFLTPSEKAAGEFQKNFLYPGVGVQFLQFSGAWSGTSIYVEAMMLVDLGSFTLAPTGALGFLYYF